MKLTLGVACFRKGYELLYVPVRTATSPVLKEIPTVWLQYVSINLFLTPFQHSFKKKVSL